MVSIRLSALIIGFDYDGTSHLNQTDPSGKHTYHEWKANATQSDEMRIECLNFWKKKSINEETPSCLY